MSQGNLGDLLAKAQQMQSKLGEVQQELARRTVEASSGGGMVTAVVTGELRVLELRIDPEVITPAQTLSQIRAAAEAKGA